MEVITEKNLKTTWKWLRRLFRTALILSIFIMLSLISLLVYISMQAPPPLQVPQTTLIYDSNDSIVAESHYGEKRYWVDLDDISRNVIDATLAIEDRRFYTHHGFDFTRIAGAIITNIKKQAKAQGASTITQQYARNLFLGHEKTWTRKWNEALYALKLEMNYSKTDILQGYLNTIYYGHGAYGIEAAARHYFNKQAADLSLAEASLLAGIPKGPSYYSPFLNFDRAKARQGVILQVMANGGVITEQQANEARQAELQLVSEKIDRNESIAPYFQDVVKKLLVQEHGLDVQLLESGGLHIYTTLDPTMQREAKKLVDEQFDPQSELEVALAAINPKTGDVKVLIGGRDYANSPFNRATKSKRSPGSTFKPFLYYAALEQGFTPSTTLVSEPTTFAYDEGRRKYSPGNFADIYAHDFITLAQALAFSDNIYAVKTHLFLGQNHLVDTAKRMGISSPLDEIPSLALGTKPVGVLEITNSYSAFANGGNKVKPRFIRKVVDQHGKIIFEQDPKVEPVLDPRLAFVMANLMTGMFDQSLNDYTSVTGGRISGLLNRPAAGKSGSTLTDSWMIGFTPQLVAGVWVGYDQNKKLNHATEGQYSKQIWVKFIENALKDELKLPFRKPKGVIGVHINPSNGKLATEACPVQKLMYYSKGTEPTDYCTDHIEDPKQAPPVEEEEHVKEKFLDRFFKWLH